MKPIRLSIEGFNSFSQKQEIDFERLSSMGIFGIFGPTGSGKSSILDAITFALYGRIARDSGKSSQERYINVHRESAKVVFVFDIHTEKKNRYKIIREIKREKEGKVSTKQQKLLCLHPDREEVLAEKDAQFRKEIDRVIGLQYEDFIKTVVLPQGGFNEFLKLEGAERRKILERLFGLEEYGEKLEERISARLKQTEDRLHILEGELNAFSDIKEEGEKLLKKELEELEAKMERLSLRKEKSDADLLRSKNIYDTLLRMQELEKLLEEGRSRVQSIERMREEAKRAEKAEPVLESIEEYEDGKRQRTEESALCIRLREEDEIFLQEAKRKEERFLSVEERKKREGSRLLQRQLELEKLAQDWKQYEKKKEEAARLGFLLEKQEKEIQKSAEQKEHCKARIEQAKEGSQRERIFLREHVIDHEYRESLRAAAHCFREKKEEERRKKEANFILEGLLQEEERADALLESLKKEAEGKRKRQEEIAKRILRLKEEPLCDSEYLHRQEKLYESLQARLAELILCKEEEKAALEKQKKEEAEHHSYSRRMGELKQEEEKLRRKKREAEIRESASLIRLSLEEGDCCPVCRQRVQGIERTGQEEKDLLQEELVLLEQKLGEAESEKTVLTGLLARAELGIKRAKEEEENAKKKAGRCLEEIENLKATFSEGKNAGIFEKIPGNERGSRIYPEGDLPQMLQAEIEKESAGLRLHAIKLQKEREEAEREEKRIEEESVGIRLKISELLAKKSSYRENAKSRRKDILRMEERIGKLEEEFGKIDKKASGEDPERELKELLELESRIQKSREIVDRADEDIRCYGEALSEAEDGLRLREVEHARTQEQEKELQRMLLEYEKAFKSSLGELKDPCKKLLEIENEIKSLEEEYRIIAKEREEAGRLAAESQKNLALQEQKLESLDKKLAGMEEALQTKLGSLCSERDQKNLDDLDEAIREVKTWRLSKAQREERESRAQEYLNEMREREGAWKALKEVVGEESLSSEEFERIEEENRELNRAYTKMLEELAAGKDRHAQICLRLERAKEVLKEQKSLEEHRGMLAELRKITGAKKFVEFMAIRQLRYITLQATKKLDEITGGAYSIEVDEQGIFKIRDNKNGGCLRSVKSLSGGETFIVSLALALSLSAHIQLKGVAPLELFFLDEGFGTLDDELLETVIEALEKIHHERLRIGLISHIEYLKQRIPVKLIVEPALAGEGGSRAKIVYS